MKKKLEIKNKKAFFDYEIIESYEAGIVLLGTEIKSIRNKSVSFTDSYCLFDFNGDLYLKNLHIAEYENHSHTSHEPKRDRKLLLNKKELSKLEDKIKIKGYTIIPLKIYLKNGWAKVQIGLAKGKRKYDKKQTIKEKDLEKDQNRELKKIN